MQTALQGTAFQTGSEPLKVFVVLMLEYRFQPWGKRFLIQFPFRVNLLCISLGRSASLNTIL